MGRNGEIADHRTTINELISAGYQAGLEDFELVTSAWEHHRINPKNEHRLITDPSQRVFLALPIIIDTKAKYLLLQAGLPESIYANSQPVPGNESWRMIKAKLSQKDKIKWLEKQKLGRHSAWDAGLRVDGKETVPEWKNTINALKEHAVPDPTWSHKSRKPLIIPSIIFSPPLFRYQCQLTQGIDIDPRSETDRSVSHEGNHLDVMGRIQSWPDGQGDKNSVKGKIHTLINILFLQFSLSPSPMLNDIFVSLIKEHDSVAPRGHVQEFFAYLAELLESGQSVSEADLAWASSTLNERNLFGLMLAEEVMATFGPRQSAILGRQVIDQLVVI